jgi:hypothetical protein
MVDPDFIKAAREAAERLRARMVPEAIDPEWEIGEASFNTLIAAALFHQVLKGFGDAAGRPSADQLMMGMKTLVMMFGADAIVDEAPSRLM